MNKYEALGRYIEAKEKLAKLTEKREIFAGKIIDASQHLQGISATSLKKTSAEITEMLEQFIKINNEALELVAEINQYAEVCERPKVS
ncbi:TPA: hypothetical protein SIC75_001217 [Pasteurella multocida]|uniref:Uncharacterized protein n=3 Tax=Pasteurella multocida TaxID=747 RepID=A0AAW8VAC3_PASMD|nr:hypothetical protein [Pasteurella multocida]AFF24626.1 hypothetical protein PMCN06_1396 [Pasteurella multocida subsp. multocida str. HN06]ANJ89304.1 hypothetical protein PMCN01_0055 [Pasteurella multocida subsp. multocida HB01]ANJ90555.1 hypothetical protein PMCN01_1333 [Pasteurella multocida subsp. multocida HB01]AON58473.1 hypothetical protein AZI96_06940 [Pasteurella multocida]AON59313.1 hypothetical protein AZI96_11485 [Pasteurella multocida]